MDRKSFLTAGVAATVSKSKPASVAHATKTSRTNSGISQYAGTWGDNEVIHLLKRTMFGAKIADINYFKGKTMSQAVDELFIPVTTPLPPVNNYQAKYTDPTAILKGDTWVNAAYGDGTVNNYREASLRSWWVGLMHNQNRTITEKMVLFWHNHFSTEIIAVADARFSYKFHATLRQYALGDFKAFVKAVTLEPMMLIYLNGYANTKNAPDENYGREMQELFCCGKGTNSQYTEDDVKAAAKVLTGINVDKNLITYKYISTNHDTTNKTFSPFYNNTVITGQTGAAGINEVDDLIAMLLSGKPSGQTVPETAYFISRKLYRWFVYYDIDSTTEANVIAPMAAAFFNANWDITVPLKLLLKSDHFYDALNMGCQIKGPVDLTIGALREFNVSIANADPTPLYDTLYTVYNAMSTFQQAIGDPPNVAGWPAYYQVPMYYEMWINSDTLPKRASVIDLFIGTGYGLVPPIDPIAFADATSVPFDPNILVSDALKYLLRIDLSPINRDYIKTSTLLGGFTNDNIWTLAWNTFNADRTNAINKAAVKGKLQQMLKYILDLAEYHLS